MTIRDWEILDDQLAGDFEVFRVRRKLKRSPRTGAELPFHLLELPDWVGVVALTHTGEVIMVDQFRHGVEHSSLEFPAGIVDPGEPPENAARRELEEETGYHAGNCQLLTTVHPNPAFQPNRLFTALALDCTLFGIPNQDPGEDLHVRTIRPDQIDTLIADGHIHHALSIVSWYLARRRIGGRWAARLE